MANLKDLIVSGVGRFVGKVYASEFVGKLTGNSDTTTKWATARNINGMSVQGDANRINYGTCSTAAATVAKTVACTGFALVTGAEITVKFTVTNTAANPTLNVNSTGAKAIYYRGAAISAGYLAANRTYTFRYNGTQYELVGDINTDSNTDTKVTSTNTNPTSATTYYPTFVTGSTTGGVAFNNGLSYYALEGTTSANGHGILRLGNSTVSGTAANKYGRLDIFSTSSGYGYLTQAATTSAVSHVLPTTGGTILNSGTTSFTQSLTSGTAVGTLKINGTSIVLYAPTNTDTHYTSHLYVGASGGNANATTATSNPYLLCVDNTTNRNSIQLKAGTNMAISAVNGVVTFTATDTTYSNMTAATSSVAGKAGLVPAPAAGAQAKFLRGDGTWQTPTNTTYSAATQSTAGLMSAADKKKLDGVATGANAYSLPTASSSTLGGVKTTSTVTSTTGLTACPIISGVPYYKDAGTSFIPLSGSTGITGTLRTNSELQSTTANGLRIAYGNYGFFIRNDGTNTYFLLTASGDQYGSYNDLRPLTINNSTGKVTCNHSILTNSISTTATSYVKGCLGVGAKTAWNDTNEGWFIGSDGTIHATRGSSSAGAYMGFHWNFSAAATSSIDEQSSGVLRLTPSVMIGNNATAVKLIKCGTSVFTTTSAGATNHTLMTLDTVKGWYSSASQTNTTIFVCNADGDANSAHTDCATFMGSSNKWHVTFDKSNSTAIRVNWMVVCW